MVKVLHTTDKMYTIDVFRVFYISSYGSPLTPTLSTLLNDL